MLSCKTITTILCDKKNFNFVVKSYEENESPFDNVLWQKWKQAEAIKAFRYTLNIRSSKTLLGKYKFLAQLNPDRGQYRRPVELITSMSQPFDPNRFNFTKLAHQEILFDVGNSDTNDVIAINVSPLEQGHCLLLTERFKCLPQVMTKHSLRKAIELLLLSNSWSLRLAFNSLCAFASVNNLHWHLYYLKHEMLLEYIDVCHYTSDVYLLVEYPAKGLCLKLSSFKGVNGFVSRAFLIANYLQQHQLPYNVYITRAKSKSNDTLYNDIRLYIWIRKPFIGTKSTTAFLPAVCELFGHLSIRDETAYNNLVEDDVINILTDTTEQPFLLVKDKLRCFLEKHMVNDVLEIPGE